MADSAGFPPRVEGTLIHSGPGVLRLLLDEPTTDAVLESIERIYDTVGCLWSRNYLAERIAKKHTQLVLLEAWESRPDDHVGMGAVGLLEIDRPSNFRALNLSLDVRHHLAPDITDRLAEYLASVAAPADSPKWCDLILVLANAAMPCPEGFDYHAEKGGLWSMVRDLNPQRMAHA